MRRIPILRTLLCLACPTAAFADTPRVVTDIAPVHSLVAQVMAGIGEPDLIIEGSGSPHNYAMRPSQAASLQDADIVIWIGEDLTPWLGRAIDTLSDDTQQIALMDAASPVLFEIRAGARFGEHSHDHGEDGHDEDGHSDDDHKEDGHDNFDPHVWLDPVNARAWLATIAAELATVDPANAELYLANAARGQDEMDRLIEELDATLGPVRMKPFIVFHDAFHYFEARFDVEASGAVALSDATSPSAARLDEIGHAIEDSGALCLFAEPQFSASVLETVGRDTGLRTGTLDPLGADIPPGPAHYTTLLRNLAAGLVECLDR